MARKRNSKKENVVIEDDNKILRVLVTNSNQQKVDVIYHFGDDDTPINYTLVSSCDSCFQKYLSTEIANRLFKWKKIDDSTYISKYSCRRFLKIHRSIYSFDIVQHDIIKSEYENLIKYVGNKKN